MNLIVKSCAAYPCSVLTIERSGCMECLTGKDRPCCQYTSEQSQKSAHDSTQVAINMIP